MKKLNHYFQKVSLKSIVLILVTTMLLAIPRMNVYSVVGAYQKSSMAITANNNSQLHKGDKERPIYPTIAAVVFLSVGSGIFLLAIAAASASIFYNAYYYQYQTKQQRNQSKGGPRNQSKGQQHPISLDHINYSKYNFSQFDN